MGSLESIYTNDIHNELKAWYAMWPPTDRIQIGDYGILDGNWFRKKVGNITKDFGVPVVPSELSSTSDQELKIGKSVEVKSIAKGSAENAKASLSINFSNGSGVFFKAANCINQSIDNYKEIGDNLLNLSSEKKWNNNFVVVTEVMSAGATTIIISESNQASIEIQANSDSVPSIDLVNANLDVSIVSSKNIAYNLFMKDGLIPLIGLSKIQKKLWHSSFDTKSLVDMNTFLDNAKEKGIKANDAVYFGRLAGN